MVYYCTIEKEGNEFIAQFPDMTNIVTSGLSREEALAMAKEALDGCLEADMSSGQYHTSTCLSKGVSCCRSEPYYRSLTTAGTPGRTESNRHCQKAGAFLPGISAAGKPPKIKPYHQNT
jgi:predicted RNase H-like HicB family nuclease